MTTPRSTPTADAPETITVEEFARKLRVTRGTINNLRKRPEANFPKPIPTGLRHLAFRRDEADAYARYGANWRTAREFA